VANADPGRYFVQVEAEDSPAANDRHGSNAFGIRASTNATWTEATSACSSAPEDTTYFSPTCLSVGASGWLGVHALIAGGAVFPVSDLSSAPPAGQLVIEVWDPGEGALSLEILDPLLRSESFDWEVVNRSGSDTPPTGGFTGFVMQAGGLPCVLAPPNCAELDVSGSGHPQPGPNRLSSSRYNDRLLRFTVLTPDDFPGEYGDASWYWMRYLTASVPTDRTEWRAFLWESGLGG
jgi:hypothetical protein